MNYNLTPYVSYSAEIAQNGYDYAATNKGPNLKIGHDHEFADYVAQKILVNRFEVLETIFHHSHSLGGI